MVIGGCHWNRWGWAVLTAAAPAMVYYALFGLVFDTLTPDLTRLGGIALTFLWETTPPAERAAVLAADIAARYRIGIAIVGIAVVSAAALVVGGARVLRPYPDWVKGAAAAVAMAAGGLGWWEQWGNRLRHVLADCSPAERAALCPLDLAVARPGGVLDADVLAHVQLLISGASILGVGASGVLVLGLVALAAPGRDPPDATTEPAAVPPAQRKVTIDQLSPDRLRQRIQGFGMTITLAAVLLSFSVAAVHGFYSWAAALVAPPAAVPLGQLALAAATYWGGVYTAITLLTALPCAMGIYADVRRASTRATTSYAERVAWEKAEGVAFEPLKGLSAVILAAGPLVTAPVLDALKGALG